MPAVNRKSFYGKKANKSSDGDSQSEQRWPRDPKDKASSVVVPPTEPSVSGTFLSAPTSGFSPPVIRSPAVEVHLNTRFARTLCRKNLLSSFTPSTNSSSLSVERVASVKPLSSSNKVEEWVKSVAGKENESNHSRESNGEKGKENCTPAVTSCARTQQVNTKSSTRRTLRNQRPLLLSPRSKRLTELCDPGRSSNADTLRPLSPLKVLQNCSPQATRHKHDSTNLPLCTDNKKIASSAADTTRGATHDSLNDDKSAAPIQETNTPLSHHSSQQVAAKQDGSGMGDEAASSPDFFGDGDEFPPTRQQSSLFPNHSNHPVTADVRGKTESEARTVITPDLFEENSPSVTSNLQHSNAGSRQSSSQPASPVGRPQRSCRQNTRRIVQSSDSENEENWGSSHSDDYRPPVSPSSSSIISETSVRQRSEEQNSLSPPNSPDAQPTTPTGRLTRRRTQPTSTVVASATDKPARRKGTSKLIRTNKKLRNSGQEYKTIKGKTISAREMKPLPACRMKCASKINEERRGEIFEEYWGLKEFDLRINYITGHVFQDQKTTSRKRDEGSSRSRTCTLRYELEQDSVRVKVCKKCFLATLGENDGFVKRALLNKRKSYSGVTKSDQRGKKPSAKKTPQNVLVCIQNHITSFPKYESHYGRSDSNKQYLGADVNMNLMYNLYIENNNNPKISISTYIREFRKTGLKFKPPAVDTCNKCDNFTQALRVTQSAEEKTQLEEERKVHHQKAEAAFAAKKADKLSAKDDPTKQVIAFDLEQVLPCPLLSSGQTFYKRQLNIYNLTVYNCSTSEAINYMWSETDGGRGANEIASCLTRYLKEEVREPVTHITMYSDTCTGQNKNSHVCAALITCIKDHPSLQVIDHKFLIPGHTFMECDQIHAQIEKKKRKTTVEIHHPNNWYNFIRTIPYKNSNLKVHEMKQRHFLDFAALLILKKNGPLIIREKNCDGDHFLFGPVQWFRYNKDNFTTVQYKTDIEDTAPFLKLSFRRRGKLGDAALQLKQCYNEMLPITVEKKNDLLVLLPQVNHMYHDFYHSLPSSRNLTNTDPDCIPQSVDIAEVLRQEVAD